MSAMEREDPTKPETWKMEVADSRDVAGRCLAGLRSNGIPATRVELDATKLKGGYICDTMRVKIYYGPGSPGGSSAGDAGGGGVEAAPRRGAVSARPETAILKIASPASADHDVAMRLRLYEREWHFYETLSHRVPIRVPRWLGSVKDVETGLTTEGVLLEDLDVPGAVLCPQLDDAGVLLTIQSGAPRRFRVSADARTRGRRPPMFGRVERRHREEGCTRASTAGTSRSTTRRSGTRRSSRRARSA